MTQDYTIQPTVYLDATIPSYLFDERESITPLELFAEED